ncbi:MAG: hypothetical protein ACXVZX_05345 [Terriglobales bacterium]
MKKDHVEARRKMISDAFHTLNQPLTGLHCGLEIALQKPRSEGEYRQRINDGLQNAGAILRLIKAVRQLVDAADPGERFGTVNVPMLMSQLKSELEVVAEPTGVSLDVQEDVEASMLADPGKLLFALGSLGAGEIESVEPGGAVSISTTVRTKLLHISISGAGNRKAAPSGLEHNLTQIRRDAAYSYVWTLGGEVEVTDDGLRIALPIASS